MSGPPPPPVPQRPAGSGNGTVSAPNYENCSSEKLNILLESETRRLANLKAANNAEFATLISESEAEITVLKDALLAALLRDHNAKPATPAQPVDT